MDLQTFPNPAAVETLKLELSLLQVLHHRNKNQHHLQPFFKHLSILKRTLGLLLDHPESEFLLRKLRTVVIPKAWESFSRVVARGEFVALGIVMVAAVGRISYCLGGLELGDEIIYEDIDVKEQGEELGVVVRRHMMDQETIPGDLDNYDESDMAVDFTASPPVEMENVSAMENHSNDVPSRAESLENPSLGEIQPPLKKRRKKKPMDDIDILFASIEQKE